jgi:hypothetical protein
VNLEEGQKADRRRGERGGESGEQETSLTFSLCVGTQCWFQFDRRDIHFNFWIGVVGKIETARWWDRFGGGESSDPERKIGRWQHRLTQVRQLL